MFVESSLEKVLDINLKIILDIFSLNFIFNCYNYLLITCIFLQQIFLLVEVKIVRI